jgi:glycosyltransferase involved in cell wall biosynthesis
MSQANEFKSGPLVSVILPTFNRPLYLAQALESVVRQRYRNLQIIVINDGGSDVTGIVESFSDPRVIFINRKQNRGKAFSLNEALARAEGKYIAYLDDDDIHYPNHIETLVEALENDGSCGVAYTDLYKVFCRIAPDGKRTALSKIIQVSRDFDRFVMLYFNHVLHVSCMHHKDLLDKTGPYNENLTVLIDWDITRRLAFFTDFHHITQITGEYFYPESNSDRISHKQRKSRPDYTRNALTIRTTRPAKPWDKIADLSIIVLAEKLDKQVGATLGLIWRYTFYPYKAYLPIPAKDFDFLNTDMPNVVKVPVDTFSTRLQCIDRILADCDEEFVAIVPAGFPIRDMWIEDSLYALLNTSNNCEAFELEGSTPTCRAVVAHKEHLNLVRGKYPQLSIYEGLSAAGINVRRIKPDEIPFQFDTLLEKAGQDEENGNYKQAAEVYEYIGRNYGNQLWMKSLAVGALFKAGNFTKAAELVAEINQQRPTVETLLLEAKLKRRNRDFKRAVSLLRSAEEMLTNMEFSDMSAPVITNALSENK